MMKTTIDAVNALEAEMSIKNNAVHYNGGFYESAPDNNHYTHVCSKKEFNQLVDEMATNYGTSETYSDYKVNYEMINDDMKPVTVPVYTQEMADDGVLPLVGMPCEFETTFFTMKSSNTGTCKPIAFHGGKVWLENGDSEYVICLKVITFKPVTPPIVLEDGKAYQFTYDTESSLLLDDITGVYDSDKVTCMWVKGNAYSITRCTNIQLLEVTK